jgi:hypothetical protein
MIASWRSATMPVLPHVVHGDDTPALHVQVPLLRDVLGPGLPWRVEVHHGQAARPWEIIRRQGEPKSEFDLEQIIDLYDGCVRNFDDEVERVLDYLEASGLADNTIVVVFSDHGSNSSSTRPGARATARSATSRPACRSSWPTRATRCRARVSDVVRTIDLAPTLLDLADLPVPPTMEGCRWRRWCAATALAGELPAFYETGVWLTDLPGTPDGTSDTRTCRSCWRSRTRPAA